MIKNVKAIFILLLATSLLSLSFIEKDGHTEGLNIGDKAPFFSVGDKEHEVNLNMYQGEKVLISFWASYDAYSRLQNANLNHAVSKSHKVKMVSLSFDEYQSIFDNTIKKDQITSNNCYIGRLDSDSKLYKTYRIAKGFRNYLLDEKGNIIAKDISLVQLDSLLN